MRFDLSLAAPLAVGAVAFSLPEIAASQETGDALNIMTTDEIEWAPAPAGEFPEGAELAVLAGNPDEEQPFVLRLRLPDGTEIPPHSEKKTHHITVVEGTFHVGEGDTIDRLAATALTAGDFVTAPADLTHFAWTEGTTIIDVFGLGPLEMEVPGQ